MKGYEENDRDIKQTKCYKGTKNMIPQLATKTKTMTISREKLVELIKAYQKKHIRWGGCPTHERVIKEYLQELGLWFDKLEAVGSCKGYVVHYHDRCPWAR